jgi:hypothetical protein
MVGNICGWALSGIGVGVRGWSSWIEMAIGVCKTSCHIGTEGCALGDVSWSSANYFGVRAGVDGGNDVNVIEWAVGGGADGSLENAVGGEEVAVICKYFHSIVFIVWSGVFGAPCCLEGTFASMTSNSEQKVGAPR